jgi:hypothetical protein
MNNIMFASDGYEDASLRPQIVVQTIPEPATCFLPGIGLGALLFVKIKRGGKNA